MTTEHACGAYPPSGICARCDGPTHRGEPADMQGVWYWCRASVAYTCPPTLVIDHCECDESEAS